jgi:DNA invertase Pin-like site-specific DNA recombinase
MVLNSARVEAKLQHVGRQTILNRRIAEPTDRSIGSNGRSWPARYDAAYTRQRNERIRKLRAQGLTLRAIAAEVGCSSETVYRVTQ